MRKKVTYQPAADERLVLSGRTAPAGERVYLHELGQYLGFPVLLLAKQARRLEQLHRVRDGAYFRQFVTPYVAQRLIAYARAIQGEHYLCRKNYHRMLESGRRATAAYRARNKGAPLSPLTPTCVQTEAEGQR